MLCFLQESPDEATVKAATQSADDGDDDVNVENLVAPDGVEEELIKADVASSLATKLKKTLQPYGVDCIEGNITFYKSLVSPDILVCVCLSKSRCSTFSINPCER